MPQPDQNIGVPSSAMPPQLPPSQGAGMPPPGGPGMPGPGGTGQPPMDLPSAINQHMEPVIHVMGAQFAHHQDRLDKIEEMLHSLVKLFHDYGRGKMRDGWKSEMMAGPHGESLGKLESIHSDLYGSPLTDRIMDHMEKDKIPSEHMHELAGHYVSHFGKHFGIGEAPDASHLPEEKTLGESSAGEDKVAGGTAEKGAKPADIGVKPHKNPDERNITDNKEAPKIEKEDKAQTAEIEDASGKATEEKDDEDEKDPVMKMYKHLKSKTAKAS